MTGAPCTAGPSAMGPPPDGLTQTAVGQPLRPKNRTAEEEKREKQQEDVALLRRALVEGRRLVDAAVAVGLTPKTHFVLPHPM